MIAMALVVSDKLYYREIDKNETINIGPDKTCEMVVHELEKRISVTWKNDNAEVVISEKTVKAKNKFPKSGSSTILTAQIGEFTVIDDKNRIFVSFAYVSQSDKRVYFDYNCKISVGRSEKKAQDGTENTILVKLPFVSSWHMDIISQNGKLFVRNKSTTNGTFVNGERIVEKELHPGDEISILTLRMIYDGYSLYFFNTENALTVKKTKKVSTHSEGMEKKKETVFFERSVRLKNCVESETIVIPSPPFMGEKPRIDYLGTFLPAIITVSIGVVMFFVMGNVTSLIYSLPMSLSGVIVSVLNYRKQTRDYNSNCSNAVENFKLKIHEAEKKLKNFNAKQAAIMNEEKPGIPRLINAAETRTGMLWNRQTSDDDFLTIRIGSGKTATMADIRLDIPSGSKELDYAKECRSLKKKYSSVDGTPICYDIRKSHISGIVGTPTDTTKLIRNMLIQLTACHCYTDLRIVYLDSKPNMAWVSKLPHVNGWFASSQAEVDSILENLIPILQEREKKVSSRNSYGKAPMFYPYILFVIADPFLLSKNYKTQKYIIESEQLGTGVIMAVEEMEQLPISCQSVIRLNGNTGELFFKENSSNKTRFEIEVVDNSTGMHFADVLENVRVRENSTEGSGADNTKAIPTKYTFYDMLGIKSAKELDLKIRWKESDICKSVKAPLGIGADGIVELDIYGSATADGPHGLVAGTVGSGKSETIVSYLLALTTLYSPLDLSLVIIDFKGGAMCNKFIGIPHLVGSITNLAGKEIERSLKFLKAEMNHRQQLMMEASDAVASHDINNVNRYTRLFKAGKVKEPMPHLLIVVDEFAELKAEYPEFLKELVHVARIGRSLGVHLILATQKPVGQVSDQIWANSKFRICLKVVTEQDSKEMIKTDQASKIKEAGRAYLMVGNNDRYELLQSGYSGAPEPTASRSTEQLSQFSATVNQIADYCARENIQKMPDLFLEPLPEQTVFHPKDTVGDTSGTVEIGIYDDPERKTQGVYTLSLVSNNLLIIGSTQMGKTNLLQTLICSLTQQYSPKDVSIYILDFASQMFRKYESLNHVGGVVTSAEDEKLKHLMQLLNHELTSRREKFAKAGVTSLKAYRELGRTDIPHIVLMIDNLTALKELYFQDDTELITLFRDGLSVGITVVATNSHTKGISFKYLSYFGARIAFYNNDSSEYGNLFDYCRETVEKIPGRCLVVRDNRLLDCQTYLAFEGSLNSAIKILAAKIHAKHGEQRAIRIPELPKTLTTVDLISQCEKIYCTPYSIAMGLDYETVGPVVRNLGKVGCLSLAGGSFEAQSAYLTSVIRQMNTAYSGKTKIWILDSVDRMLQPMKELQNVVRYSINPEAALEFIEELAQKAKARMAMLELGDMNSIADAELLVLVINNPIVADILNTNKTALMSYSSLFTKYKGMGICVLVSNVPNASFISSEFYKKSVENKQFLWFDNLHALKIVTVPYTESKKFSKKLDAGDVYLFNDTECMKLKTPLS